MHKKILCLLVLMSGFMASVSASTVQWLIRPEYDAISYFSETIYKCKTNGKYQLVDLNGQTLLPHAVDSITNYSEGIAVVLEKAGDHYKVIGFFKEASNSFLSISGDYFAGMYSFFSEGLIAVADAHTDLFGYLNDNGEKPAQQALRFNYLKARPFIQGWASVEPQKRTKRSQSTTLYINKKGETLAIDKKFHNGKVVLGSSFNSSGEALIAHYGHDNAIINTSGNIVRKYNGQGKTPIRACDFAFDENGLGCAPPITPTTKTNISSFTENGFFGYMSEEKTMVPAQFTYAGPFFANGCAIAAIDNKFGVLSLVEGEFNATLDSDNKAKNNKSYILTLHIPEEVAQNAEVKFDNGNGTLLPIALQNDTYKFSNKEKEFTVRAQVIADGLLLLDETITKKTKEQPFIIIGPSCDNTRANSNNLVRVKVVVKNNTEDAANVKCSFIGNFDKNKQNDFDHNSNREPSSIIAAKKSETFYVDVFVKNTEKVTFSVSVTIDGKQYKKQSKDIEIRPIYSFKPINH